MDRNESLNWLREQDPERLQILWSMADHARREAVGDEVHLRGLIEFSNECDRQCSYCGLRQPNHRLRRYRMSSAEVLACAMSAKKLGYGTVVLQSGELSAMCAAEICDMIVSTKTETGLAITLSLGEKDEQNLRFWRRCGADRYLLRFETSDTALYRRLHPPLRPSDSPRLEMLSTLRGLGYEVGSGIIVGLPGQTWASVATDLEHFRSLDLDMIAVGPFIPHPHTPLGVRFSGGPDPGPDQVPNTEVATLKVVALARLLCPEANIPATTAAALVGSRSYRTALECGANVVMPKLTPRVYSAAYQPYLGRPPRTLAEEHPFVLSLLGQLQRPPGDGRGERNGRCRLVSKVTRIV